MSDKIIYCIYGVRSNFVKTRPFIKIEKEKSHEIVSFKKESNLTYNVYLFSCSSSKNKFKIDLYFGTNNYSSKEFIIPNDKTCLFIYDLIFEASGILIKDLPPPKCDFSFTEQYLIFKKNLKSVFEKYSHIKSEFFEQSFQKIDKEELDIICFLDLFQTFKDDSLKITFLIELFGNLKNLKCEDKLELKTYNHFIDNCSSEEFQKKLSSMKNINMVNFHRIIIYCYYEMEEFDKFKNYYKKIEKEYPRLLFFFINTFKNFDIEIIYSMIENSKFLKNEELKKILMKGQNLEEILNIINNKFSKINELLNSFNEKYIKIDDPELISNSDNIQNIVTLYKGILEKNKTNELIIIDYKLWTLYILKLTNINIDKLLDLYEVESLIENTNQKEFKNSLDTALENTFMKYMEENKLENLSMINYFISYFEKHKPIIPKFKELKLDDYINLSKVDEEFITYFKEKDFIQYFSDSNIEKIITNLLLKINNFDDLLIIFRIFTEIINRFLYVFKEKLTEKFKNLLKNLEESFLIEKFPGILIEITKMIPGVWEAFLTEIENSINSNNIILIYKELLNNKSCQKDMSQHIIDYLISKDIFTDDTFYQFFTNLNKDDDKINFLKKFGDVKGRKITKKAYYDINESESLKYLDIYLNLNVFHNNKFDEIPYVKETKKIISLINLDLKNYNLDFSQINNLKNLEEKGFLDKRLKIAFYNDIGIIPNFKKKLLEKIDLYSEFHQKIECNLLHVQKFFPHNDNKISSSLDIKLKFEELNLEKSINFIQSKKKEVNNSYKEYLEIKEYLNSKIFTFIYKEEGDDKNKSDEEILENTIKKFKILGEKILRNFTKVENLNSILTFDKRETIKEELINLNYLLFEKKTNALQKKKISTVEIENLVNKLFVYKKRYEYILYLKGCMFFIDQFQVEKTNFYQKINDFKSKLEQDVFLENINDITNYILDFDNNLIENFSQPYIIFMINIIKSENLLPFIIPKTEEDLKKIEELTGEIDNQNVTDSDIRELIELITFKETLKKYITKNDSLFFSKFKDELEKDSTKLIVSLNDVSKKFNEIYELFTKNVDTSGYAKIIIHHIFVSSKFEIKNENNEYICSVQYNIKGEKKKNEKKFREILEAKDKILLRQKRKNEEDDSENEIQQFLNIIDNIERVLELLENISSKGYFEELNSFIEIKDGIGKCKCNEKEFDSINVLINYLYNISEQQNIDEKNGYLNLEYIRLLFGKQFSQIYSNLAKKDNKYNLNVINKFITANQNLKEFNFILTEQMKDLNLYQCINEYVKELFIKNNLTFEKIYEKAKIKTEGFKGIYSFLSSPQSYEKDIIKATKYLTGNLPCAQTFLLCSPRTKREEIISFIYRSIQCETYTLFIISKIESLDLEIANFLFDLLDELYTEKNYKLNSCLLFIYLNTTCDLINQIKQLKEHHFFDPTGNEFNELIEDENEIEIIYSNASGVGKSETIMNMFKNDNNEYHYIYFPIEGDFNKEEIIERLKNIEDEKVFLHIDILDSNTKELVNIIRDFLFSFLVMKYYSLDYDFIYYGKEYKIKVETPFGFVDPFDIYPTLKFFKKKGISKDNIPPFIGSNKFNSNFQLVSQYLKMLKDNQINTTNIFIYFEKICEEVLPEHKSVTKIGDVENQPKDIGQGMQKLIPIDNISGGNLIKEYLCENEKEELTFYQINSFINVLGEQLKYLCGNFFLNCEILKESAIHFHKNSLKTIRSFIIESLISLSKYCTKSAYDNLLSGQIETSKSQSGNYNEDEALKKAMSYLDNKQIISFNELLEKTSIIFLNEDNYSLSILTIREKNTEEYKKLYDLFNSQGTKENLIDYQSLDNRKFLEEINKVLNLNVQNIDNLVKVDPNYVFTTDNFIKLLLITLKIRAKVPIIMMGETGCGKTSLIRIISQLKGNAMLTLNIHAGISNKEIITFIKEHNLIDDGTKEIITFNKEHKLNDDGTKNKTNKIWVFLDEINTCNSMGLISEMMCKGTIQGEKLKENVTFIAACNPYRRYEKKIEQVGLISDKQKVRSLVYSVNPLPHSLLNFVFDFGSLKKEDEEKYIRSMVKQPISKLKEKFPYLENNEFIDFSIKSVINAQNFIREKNFSASVSLREVRRYVILFEWFILFLDKNKELFNTILKEYSITLENCSVLLSIYICYFIRVTGKNPRKEFSELITTKFDYQQFVKKIQEKLIDNFTIEKGIAKNRILLENLFALFVCINIKIPIIICGKPGCSKSLSVKLIDMAMKGKKSENLFFQQLPALKITPYQGSITSTSNGVLEAFKLARSKIQNNQNNEEKIISVLYFDEMGLAEISPNNPLKVIHSQLEYDENEDSKKIAFVGISNWSLDASKMNRTVFLSVAEPDEEDLIDTALAIADEFENDFGIKYKEIFEYLAKSYYLFKLEVGKSNFDAEFHGTRDFYHLIKITARNLLNNNDGKNPFLIAINSIERNFAGRDNSIKTFKSIISNYQYCVDSDIYDVKNAIESNINDNQCRFLLVISNSSLSQFLIKSILEKLNKKYIFFLGSHFEEDLKNEYYSASVINKMQIGIEDGDVIIMNNLESIYPSLYDLFNQNFTYISGKKFARIALGYAHDMSVEVNDNCRIVILIDQEQIKNEDPPFLNRFEKHKLSFKDLLTKEQNKLSKDLLKMIKSLIQSNENKEPKIILSKQLLNCNKDEIDGIIYNSGKNSLIEMKEEVFKKIAPTFSQDLIIFASNSVFATRYPKDFQMILSIYNSTEHRNLYNFLKNMKNTRNVIYTFSHILDLLMKGLEVDNEIYGKINNNTIYKKIIEENYSEKLIERSIQAFLTNNKYNVIIFQIQAYNSKHLNHIQFLYENLLNNTEINNKENNKAIILIIYLKREYIHLKNENPLKSTNFISHLSSYEQTFIDNLNGDDLYITELIGLKNVDLYKNEKIYNLNQQFNNTIYPAFTTISYGIDNLIEDISFENYYEKVIEKLINNEELKEKIKNKIIEFIQKESDSLLYSTFYGNNFEKYDIDFKSILRKNLDYILKLYLVKFIVKSERDGVFPILLSPRPDIEEIKILSDEYFKKIDVTFTNVRLQLKENRITTILGLNIPMISDSIFKLHKATEEIKINFSNLEDEFRNDYEEKEEEQKKEVELLELKENNMFQNIKFECERVELFKFFIQRQNNNILNKEIFSLIQEDFYTIFIINKFKNKNISHINQFLNYIISLKFPQNENSMDFLFFSKTILWIKSYEDIIIKLLTIFDELTQIAPETFEYIRNVIDNKIVDYSNEKNNEKYKKIINEPFYSLFEAIINSIIISITKISELNEEKTNQFFEVLKATLQTILQIRYSLLIVIRGIYILSQIVEFSENLKMINLRNFQNLKKYIDFLNKEIELVQQNSMDEVENEIRNECQFIKEMFPNNYQNIINDIFCEKYRQIPKLEFKKLLFKIVCEDDSLLVKSKNLFDKLIKDIDYLQPESIYDEEDDQNEEAEDDDDNEKEAEKEENFLSFCEDDNNEILIMINEKENIIIDEIFLYLFEIKINKFFNKIEKKSKKENKYEEILKKLSFKYLKKSIQYIENKEDKPLYHLGLIYAIAYIKCYCFHYVDILVNHHAELGSAEIIESYLFGQNHPFRNVIKIYLLKLLFHIYYNDYIEFYNKMGEDKYQNWRNNGIENSDDNNQENKILDILSFDLNSIENYKKVSQYFLIEQQKNECIKLIKNDNKNFNSFIDLSINKILSLYKDNEINFEKIKYLETILNEYNSNKFENFSKDLLNQDLYNSNLKNKINSINLNSFFGILIGYKISLLCLFSENNNYYSKLMGKNILNELKNSYIPGIANENILIKSYYAIKNNLESFNNPSYGCYICSCNEFYNIDPCGLPNQTFKCSNCGQDIGGENHKLIERENHYRIYLNEGQKSQVENRSYYKPIKSMLLKEFKKDIIEKTVLEDTKGFYQLESEFNDSERSIRNLHVITYRFLNFVLYSILYFNNSIKESDFIQIIEPNQNFLDFMLKDWEIMTKELNDNNNKIDIKIYIQLILPKFFECIQNYGDFSTFQKRNEFEKKINDIIMESFEQFTNYKFEFNKHNSSLSSISKFEKIIREYKDSLNDEENYPFYKYFTSQKYPNEKNLKEILKKYPDEAQYPVIKAYLKYKEYEKIKKLKNLPLINPLENWLINKYSFNISRNDAKAKKIREIIQSNGLKELYEKFEKGWRNIYEDIIQYNCQQIKCKNINQSDALASILNDDGEIEYGMQIAGAYYYFIEAQNSFIEEICPYLTEDSILHFFKTQLENVILAQNASEGEIIDLQNFINPDFKSFEEILYNFSFRNCFKEDNNIDYFNYKEIIYDLDSIEQQLGSIILVGKRKFSTEQKFVVYEFEAYHGRNSTILNDFLERYPQSPLTQEQKRNLLNNKGNDSKTFLFSLQMLIFHLNKEGYGKDKGNINDIINNNDFPKYITLSDDFKNLFNQFQFGIEHLIEIYNYIELLSYGEVLQNVDNKYRKEIDENEVTNINNYFNQEEEQKKNRLITKNKLPTVIRKFISRYLSGIREDQEINPDEQLLELIKIRSDLWDLDTFNDSRFEEEINLMNKTFQVNVEHSVNFYDVLGGDKQIIEEKLDEVVKVENTNEKKSKKEKNIKSKQKKKFKE